MPISRLHRDQTLLLVIDMQDRLLAAVQDGSDLIRRVNQLVNGAKLLNVPISVTEQYRKGLGDTVKQVAEQLPPGTVRHDKLKFSACIEPVERELKQQGPRSVLVCGVEAHVCVLQTCLDLLDRGYTVFLATDAISSRRAHDRETGIKRLIQAGVVPTTVESALFELMHEASGPTFKAMLEIVR